ncbi:methyltransferase domain-containing protein [bacterium AH-315-E07]|nr:methyltransferase domain-containing protein [bacterium AH-315-E07]
MHTEKYKWDAKDYAQNSSAQATWANELIEKLSLAGDENVLDIGCGDGRITQKFAQTIKTGSVIGINQSQSMVQLANETFSSENLSFIQMDATKINLDTKFDIVFSNATLHWVSDHPAVLQSLKKNLNKNAKILFQMGGFGNARELLESVTQVTASEKWEKYFDDFIFPYTFFDVRDYEVWLPAYGYKPERIELIQKDMAHNDINGLKGWLRTTWFPYTDKIPASDRENFLDDLVTNYTSQHPVDSKGRTHVKIIRLEVEAIAL